MSQASKEFFIRPEQFWQDLGLSANQTVVHLGSGAGFYLIPAAQMVGKKGKVYGIDVLEQMVEEAEGRARRSGVEGIVETIQANLEDNHGSRLKKHIADWSLVANILYQSDPVKILTEAKRVTKKGGTIVVVEWENSATPLGPPPEKRIPKQTVRDIAEKLKLKQIKEFKPSPYHYGILLAP